MEAEKNDVLLKIRNQFLCCLSLHKIEWTILTNISWDSQLELLQATVLHPRVLKYPISTNYQISFVKHILKALESQQENVEIHDAVYEELCRVNSMAVSEWAYKHYAINNSIITIKETNSYISNGTTGLRSWQASLALSEWVLAHKQEFINAQVLELGSGTGLLGFVIDKLCNPAKVCLSDYHESVLSLLNENMHINNSLNNNLKSEILQISWEEPDVCAIMSTIQPNIIIAADVVYDDTLFGPLIQTIGELFKARDNACRFILASTIRNPDTYKKFLTMLEAADFVSNNLEYTTPHLLSWDESTEIKIINVIKKC